MNRKSRRLMGIAICALLLASSGLIRSAKAIPEDDYICWWDIQEQTWCHHYPCPITRCELDNILHGFCDGTGAVCYYDNPLKCPPEDGFCPNLQ